MENIISYDVELPGFRFHPTEEELVNYYLKETALGNNLYSNIIGFLNIYKHHPCELPDMAKIGEREWYFFVHRPQRTGHGGKLNRTTEKGYWKATGSDRKIMHFTDPKRTVGYRKTLVFYTGKAPKGGRTDWVMNEYRLSDTNFLAEDIVLCKIYRKATSLKVLEQRAEEHAARESNILPSYATPLLSLQDLDFGAEAENLESRKEPLVRGGYMEAESAGIEYFTQYGPK
ncbi:hypothetical protein V6N13_053144 [Hibiscus sabdariffa]